MKRSYGLVALAALWATSPARAEDDDFAPIPSKAAPKPAAKPAPKAAVKVAPKAAAKTKAPKADDDDFAPVAKAQLAVKLTSPIAGARLFIDDDEVGPLPQGVLQMAPGAHSVVVKRAGYATFVKKVSLVPGKPVEVAVTLEARAAVLSVTSNIAGAEIVVNGRTMGRTPLGDIEVAPGEVELTVRKEALESTQKITVYAGREYPIDVRLAEGASAVATVAPVGVNPAAVSTPSATVQAAPDSPLYTKWWLWAGVGAVVVAGVVTTVAVAAAPAPRLLDEACKQNSCSTIITGPSGVLAF